ncbi:GNAT family N-acetyltransferase [Panacibacter sp. DH6]|uniref:GNAT family N-acetyltransferase n=1 Tax=Panacibacter microcysteis TaxID=2793269 RepID=A0A931E6U6_9BACT|nr:GNAT family N-acetyltransferase [Panacibacter microcysteis]MBG9377252.1 GNAT family N-acetyltransferase [Panacibacter microcysteis]
MIEIIPYSDEYAAVFKVMNLAWLDHYNLTESHDLLILNNPRKTILESGGAIFLAKAGDEIVGSAAIINEGEGVFELAKMTVTAPFQGKGISKMLLEKCIETARLLHATKLILFSNSQLTTAIALYRKYGFTHVSVTDAPFLTADIKMELSL